MKQNDEDDDLAQLLQQWKPHTLDLSNIEQNVRRRIALDKLRPTLASRILDAVDAWKSAFSLRPAMGTILSAIALFAGSAGGFALAAPAVDRLESQAKITYATRINPVLQARNSQ